MGSLNIIRAESAGACFGVQRALDMTLAAAQTGSKVCTLGPLIHNPRVVEELKEKGIDVAHSVDTVVADDVVIRSHGVVPEVIDQLKDSGFKVIDATCPHVMRAQKAAARLASEGYLVLVVGEEGHPEVEGISAHARATGGKCLVIADASGIPEDVSDPVGVVIQTTQPFARLEEVVAALRDRGCDPMVYDTVCSATVHRQQAAREMAATVDAMLVIGGRNSSNTTRLYEICSEHCSNTHHIECADEIVPSWFQAGQTVGISAGASTPEAHICEVETYLESLEL